MYVCAQICACKHQNVCVKVQHVHASLHVSTHMVGRIYIQAHVLCNARLENFNVRVQIMLNT